MAHGAVPADWTDMSELCASSSAKSISETFSSYLSPSGLWECGKAERSWRSFSKAQRESVSFCGFPLRRHFHQAPVALSFWFFLFLSLLRKCSTAVLSPRMPCNRGAAWKPILGSARFDALRRPASDGASPFCVPSTDPCSNNGSLRSNSRASRWSALESNADSWPRWEISAPRAFAA